MVQQYWCFLFLTFYSSAHHHISFKCTVLLLMQLWSTLMCSMSLSVMQYFVLTKLCILHSSPEKKWMNSYFSKQVSTVDVPVFVRTSDVGAYLKCEGSSECVRGRETAYSLSRWCFQNLGKFPVQVVRNKWYYFSVDFILPVTKAWAFCHTMCMHILFYCCPAFCAASSPQHLTAGPHWGTTVVGAALQIKGCFLSQVSTGFCNNSCVMVVLSGNQDQWWYAPIMQGEPHSGETK